MKGTDTMLLLHDYVTEDAARILIQGLSCIMSEGNDYDFEPVAPLLDWIRRAYPSLTEECPAVWNAAGL